MAQTSFLLSDELLAEIDAEAERRHLSRADVIREKLHAAYPAEYTTPTTRPAPRYDTQGEDPDPEHTVYQMTHTQDELEGNTP